MLLAAQPFILLLAQATGFKWQATSELYKPDEREDQLRRITGAIDCKAHEVNKSML